MAFTLCIIIFFIISIIGLSFSIPIATAIFCHEYFVIPSFLIPMIASLILGAMTLFFFRNKKSRLTIRSSFAAVALAWISASLFGAIPLYFSGAIPNFTDAFFESVSILNKAKGYVSAIYENTVNISLVEQNDTILIGDKVYTLNKNFKVSFSMDSLGKVIDVFGSGSEKNVE